MSNTGGFQNQESQNVSKLKYRIIYCSGEDQDYPVTELLDPSSNSRGWQSQKFCDYPQEIIVQFPSLVKLRQLQFLSHQSKIASKIELFTFLPSGPQSLTSQIPLNEIEFKRLGYLSLDPNERSGFQARELKSVYVDSEAVLLKLVVHKCHLNNFNVFNQIGLIALNCMGEPITISRQAEASLPSKSIPYNVNQGGLDPETALQIKNLQQEKDIAVRDENFDLAKQIKDTIIRLQTVGQQLTKLEEQKKHAISNEDFDMAKQLKMQIESLRQSAFHPGSGYGNQMVQPPPQQLMIQSPPPMQQPPMMQQLPPPQQNFGRMPPPVHQMNNMNLNQSGYDQEEENPIDNNYQGRQDSVFGNGKPNVFGNQPKFEEIKKQAPPQFTTPPPVMKPSGPVNVDDMVLPALKSGAGKNQMSEYPDGQEGPLVSQAEELSAEDRKLAQPMINMWGEEIMQKIFSRTWQLREEGLDDIEQEIRMSKNKFNKSEAFVNGVGVTRFTIQDKHANVSQRSMAFFATICREYPSVSLDSQLKTVFLSYAEPLIQALSISIGESNTKIRTKAEDAFSVAAGHQQFGIKFCLNVLVAEAPPPVKGKPKGGKKPVLTSKQIGSRYKALHEMLLSHSFTHDQAATASRYAVKGLGNTSNDVRAPAYDCMTELYKQIGGDEISKYYEGLRQATLDTLMTKFAEIDDNSGVPTKQPKKQQAPVQTIETNIGGGGAKRKNAAAPKKSEQSSYQQQQSYHEPSTADSETICNFCGIHDPSFTEESLDIHYWKECPMLTTCWECDQVIEVQHIESHLLEECPQMGKYKFHPRCKSVLLMEEFEGHDCVKPEPQGAARCPLCTETVYPNDKDGWHKHILDKKCPGNPRLPR